MLESKSFRDYQRPECQNRSWVDKNGFSWPSCLLRASSLRLRHNFTPRGCFSRRAGRKERMVLSVYGDQLSCRISAIAPGVLPAYRLFTATQNLLVGKSLLAARIASAASRQPSGNGSRICVYGSNEETACSYVLPGRRSSRATEKSAVNKLDRPSQCVGSVQAARLLANAPANCPTRTAKGISRAAYRSPAFGLALSLSISTATVE